MRADFLNMFCFSGHLVQNQEFHIQETDMYTWLFRTLLFFFQTISLQISHISQRKNKQTPAKKIQYLIVYITLLDSLTISRNASLRKDKETMHKLTKKILPFSQDV